MSKILIINNIWREILKIIFAKFLNFFWINFWQHKEKVVLDLSLVIDAIDF